MRCIVLLFDLHTTQQYPLTRKRARSEIQEGRSFVSTQPPIPYIHNRLCRQDRRLPLGNASAAAFVHVLARSRPRSALPHAFLLYSPTSTVTLADTPACWDRHSFLFYARRL